MATVGILPKNLAVGVIIVVIQWWQWGRVGVFQWNRQRSVVVVDWGRCCAFQGETFWGCASKTTDYHMIGDEGAFLH